MQPEDQGGERTWEHHLPLVLMAAFAMAGGATLLAPSPRPAPAATPSPLTTLAPTPEPARVPGFVPIRIADVILPDGTTSGVVLLEDGEEERVLPVFLNASESAAVRDGLKTNDPRSSPELLSSAVAAMGGEVVRVELTQGAEEAVSGRVVLKRGGEETFIEARAADALALAATTQTPVYTTPRMLAAQGIRRETVERLPGGLPSRLRNPEAF